ncbi:hypothetical protein BKA67DRAFT_667668 [Truncatella angustata]|uniref:Uncharacterized protein n=1 Tax=Truncatella angustata TaxID=152316 RepID=A0A9P8UYM1_9PEZI|nr:uncharacterized protein BKA67DRAFT_667668 [Truncatella angustata]KAH6660748.1 hypothetical protein BKA67DRAFT_667668 [Truncatella angustata]
MNRPPFMTTKYVEARLEGENFEKEKRRPTRKPHRRGFKVSLTSFLLLRMPKFLMCGRDGDSILRQNLDSEDIRMWLTSEEELARLRILFIDATKELPDLLPVAESLLRDTLDIIGVNPRFTENLSRQHMPGKNIHSTRDGSTRHELWHTAYLRIEGNHNRSQSATQTLQLTRQYLTGRDTICGLTAYLKNSGNRAGTGCMTYMIWRCSRNIEASSFSTSSGEAGQKLLGHMMSGTHSRQKISYYTRISS